MLVILASRFDEAAADLKRRWSDRGASLLTGEDLSQRGWRHESLATDRGTAVIGGALRAVGEIRGVVTLLPGVTALELPHIAGEEREYVATEMTAFLVAWLSALRCPVLNRPTPINLTGPNWRPEQWAAAAHRVGLAIEPLRRVACTVRDADDGGQNPLATGPDVTETLTLVGDACVDRLNGATEDALTAGVRRLAKAAGVELMTATFVRKQGEPRFTGAVPWVDITRADVADALLDRFERVA